MTFFRKTLTKCAFFFAWQTEVIHHFFTKPIIEIEIFLETNWRKLLLFLRSLSIFFNHPLKKFLNWFCEITKMKEIVGFVKNFKNLQSFPKIKKKSLKNHMSLKELKSLKIPHITFYFPRFSFFCAISHANANFARRYWMMHNCNLKTGFCENANIYFISKTRK